MDMEEVFESMEEYEKYRNNKAIEAMGLEFAFVKNRSPSAAASSPKKMILLESLEGVTFEVEETVALESQTIRDYLEEDPNTRKMSFGITTKIMAKVVEYLKRHVDVDVDVEAKSEDLKKFDAEFVKVDRHTLTALSGAALDLQIKSLCDLVIQVKHGGKRPAKNDKMSSNEMIEAVAGVESGNEMLSGLLSVATQQPQNAEMIKLNRDFLSAFRSSKEFKMYPHKDKKAKGSSYK